MSEVGEPSRAMGVVDGVLQAFATGTFIYVTFFEILQEEIDPRDTSIGKVTSALAGPYKTLFSIPSRRVYFIPSVIVNLSVRLVVAFYSSSTGSRNMAAQQRIFN